MKGGIGFSASLGRAVLLWALLVPPMISTSLAAIVGEKSTGGASLRERGLRFEPNLGQAEQGVRYVARDAHLQVSLLDRGAVIQARSAARVSMNFVGAGTASDIRAQDANPARINYFVGADRSKWLRNVPTYGQVRYENIYPDIDLVYYGNRGGLEYDLVVKPGADPRAIRMRFDGAHKPTLSADGELLLDGPNGALRLNRPLIYQNIGNGRRLLQGRFVMRGERDVGFHVADYDRTRPLVIDPVFLLYSTYLGGVHDDQVGSVALDADNNAYVVGYSGSEDFPVSASAYQSERKMIGQYVRNVVVSKFSPSGDLLYSTFLGGSTNDYGRSIAVDAAGKAFIAGVTYSADFPTTAGSLQSTFVGSKSAFVAQLGSDGSTLRFSTLYGASGDSEASGIRLRDGRAYVGGFAGPGLTTTAGAYKTTLATGNGGFIAIFDPTRSGAAQLVAATYYGTDTPAANSVSSGITAFGIALDPQGGAWIGGQAYTHNLPTTADALQPSIPALNPNCDAGDVPLNSAGYLAHLSADLSQLAYATYLSGEREYPSNASCSEYVYSLETDSAGNLYVHGSTASGGFPVTQGAVQSTFPTASGYVGFVSKLAANGSALLWSSYLGGNNSGPTFAGRMALGTNNDLWVTGETRGGSNFPISADAQQAAPGGAGDAYTVSLNAETGALRYGSYFGGNADDVGVGIAVDAGGTVFLAGHTQSSTLPVTQNAFQSTLTPNAYDGSDWFFAVVGAGTIAQVLPVRAGNAGDVTLTVKGAGFQAGATASLVLSNGTPIQSTQAWVAADGSSATFTFALKDAATGSYQLTVNNPDQTSFSRENALTVESGGASNVSAEVVGRSTVRVGVLSTYDVVVTNSGTTDAYGVVLMVRYSNVLQPEDSTKPDPFGLPLRTVPPLDADDTEDYSQLPIVFESSLDADVSVVPLMIPRLPAGASATFSFPLKAASESDDAFVEAYVWDPIAESVDELNSDFASSTQSTGAKLLRAMSAALGKAQPTGGAGVSKGCFDALAKKAIEKALGNIPGVDCLNDFSDALASAIVAGEFANSIVAADAFGQLGTSTIKAMASCVPVAKIVKVLAELISLMEDAQTISDACKDNAKPKPGPKGSKKKSKAKSSIDPNDKVGPDGDGSVHHYITGAQPLTYSIQFENQPTASLPAAEVVVTDQLDATTLDLDTLTLGNITIGRHVINVPAGANNFNTTYALSTTLSVRIQGSLDKQSGLLKYTFVTLDPATGLPPSDPTLGFLPPDTDGIEGQAYVLFTVSAKAGLATGTEINNQANIVFDANAAIQTPVWVNTIDTAGPSSHVTALPSSQAAGDFNVTWSGTDTEAGIAIYDVYVSDNSGDFTLWQSGVSTTSASFTGVADHTYGFYSVATDGAGNSESAKTVADTTTSVTNGSAGSGTTSHHHGGGGVDGWMILFGVTLLGLRRKLRLRTNNGSW